MKKKIIGVLATIILLAVVFTTVPVMADTATSQLSRVQITLSSATLLLGGSQQFTAQAYDKQDQPITNVTYFWLVAAGGGSVNGTGLFTALSTPTSVGSYPDTVEVVAVQGKIMKLDSASVTLVASIGPLASIKVTPATANVIPGGTKQFAVQGYDSANTPIPGLTYSWTGVGSVGTLSTSGLFTAGSTTGTFTVQASVPASPAIAAGTATVTVTTTPTTSPNPEKSGKGSLFGVLKGLLKNIGSDNFLGGQWQVKNGTSTDTIKLIPGVVQTVSATSLTILPNGLTVSSTFTLTTSTVILPKDIVLAANDKVMVITINDIVTSVAKISAPGTSEKPPGLDEQDDDNGEGKDTPPGMFNGNKTGWNKDSSHGNDESDSEDD